MKVTILPKSTLGWWSIGLVAANIILFVLFEVILGSGPDYNMPLAYTLTSVAACVVLAAFIAGLISIIRNKERAILALVAMAIGIYTLFGGITSLIGLQQ